MGALKYKGKLRMGRFTFPTQEEYNQARAQANQGKVVAISTETPYWFKYDKPFDYEGTMVAVDHCTPEEAAELRSALPGRQPSKLPPCAIFSAYNYAPDSFGDKLLQSGAFALLEDKMRTFSLFELRDHPLPTQGDHSPEVMNGIKECMHDVLKLCDDLAPDSVEQLSMRTVAETLLHLLCAQGPRQTDMLDSISKFRNGNWEKLWKTAIKNFAKWQQKRKHNPIKPKGRTNKQKDKYAQKCALAGNYSKANKIICQEMLQACGDDDTLKKLERLHPAGNPILDREFWPDERIYHAFHLHNVVGRIIVDLEDVLEAV